MNLLSRWFRRLPSAPSWIEAAALATRLGRDHGQFVLAASELTMSGRRIEPVTVFWYAHTASEGSEAHWPSVARIGIGDRAGLLSPH